MSLASLRLAFTLAPWVAILLLLGWCARLNDLRDRWHHQYTAEHQVRETERTSYITAQKTAAELNQAHVARIEQQQQRITTDAEKSYAADLARLRAELAIRLRPQGTATAQGAPVQSGTPSLPVTANGPDGSGPVCIPTSDYVSGAETELRLEHLQQWIREQLKIDRN